MSDLQKITPLDKWRMYGLVPYNLSDIQKAIQYGHAVVEYGLGSIGTKGRKTYLDWARNSKTFIILDGGTTNNNEGRLGTLNIHLNTLKEDFRNWPVGTFNEIHLGDQLTAIVFIVPKNVYNKKDFPEFEEYLGNYTGSMTGSTLRDYAASLKEEGDDKYWAWVELIGGTEIVNMREFLKPFKLA